MSMTDREQEVFDEMLAAVRCPRSSVSAAAMAHRTMAMAGASACGGTPYQRTTALSAED
jgi:hypothetical protein